MTDIIAPKRGELVIEKDGRSTLRFQRFLEGLATKTASAGTDGYVVANPAITGATKTKITYDSKGLVTGGAYATTSDISEGGNLYFTSERVSDLIIDGTHLTWTFDAGANTLQGNVLVTLQNAFDDSVGVVTPNVALISIPDGEFVEVDFNGTSAWNFYNVDDLGAVGYEDNSGNNVRVDAVILNMVHSNIYMGQAGGAATVQCDAYLSAPYRVETSNDYLTVGT